MEAFNIRAKEICAETSSAIQTETDQKCQFWMMELNSGGNVKLTSCDPSQPCFNSCSELVHSRFSVADVENLGISGLEVTEVIRVENRLLFNGYVVDFQTLKCEMYCWRICMLFQLAFKIAWSQCYTRLFTNSIPPSPVCDMRDG